MLRLQVFVLHEGNLMLYLRVHQLTAGHTGQACGDLHADAACSSVCMVSASREGGLFAGEKVLGKPGRYIVAFFALLEFFGGSCVMMMLLWREVEALLPPTGKVSYVASSHQVHTFAVQVAIHGTCDQQPLCTGFVKLARKLQLLEAFSQSCKAFHCLLGMNTQSVH